MICKIDGFETDNKKSFSNHMRWHYGLMEERGIGYMAIHRYIKRRFPKPKNCSKCGDEGFLDLANKSGQYLRDISDWEWLCRQCHMEADGRFKNLLRGPGPNHKRDTNGRFLSNEMP